MNKNSVAFISHVWTPDIQRIFERLKSEAPPDHDVRFILSSDASDTMPTSIANGHIHICCSSILELPYSEKCQSGEWDINGNLDLVFLEFRRRLPDYQFYWFIEYDVHYEGRWSRFFERFQDSKADLIGTTLEYISKIPHKLQTLSYPRLVVPETAEWNESRLIKGFFPICRLTASLLDALDLAYRAKIGGHYEIIIPTVALQHDMAIEDIGGDGPFVQEQNRNCFYFANGASYTHSPGSFVFRPNIGQVLRRENTLWHPVKPAGIPAWHPLKMRGGLYQNTSEWIKLVVGRIWIRWWFATRWRPLG